MKILSFIIYTFSFSIALTSCVKEEQFDNTPMGNFEALWKIIDEHYCFFDYKKAEYGLDWNEVYRRYQPQFRSSSRCLPICFPNFATAT